MIAIFKNDCKESNIKNCTFLVNQDDKPPIFSDNEKGGLVVQMTDTWVISEEYLSDDLKSQLLKAAKNHKHTS